MQTAANFGTIPMRDGSTQATAKLLPFGGDAYGVFAFIETVVLINEAQGNERLNYTQRLMRSTRAPRSRYSRGRG